MASPKKFEIKESKDQIRRLLHRCGPVFTKRLKTLRLFKEYEGTGISRKRVVSILGVDKKSVDIWRNLYIEGGIEALLSHNIVGNRSSDIATYHQSLGEKLEDPCNGIQGYVELLVWFNEEFGTQVNYKTLNGYVKRNFKASLKIARKSHLNKDPEKVRVFKKTSLSTAGN